MGAFPQKISFIGEVSQNLWLVCLVLSPRLKAHLMDYLKLQNGHMYK